MDDLKHFMNQLPTVLQNEIWEYVRGDRKFWKEQHKLVVGQIQQIITEKTVFDVEAPNRVWANRPLICWVPWKEREHRDHIHVNFNLLITWERLLTEYPVYWRRKHIKNPKFHAEDLSFLLTKT